MKLVDLRGKRVLVTGASAGLGEEIARQLATVYGAHPVLVARRRDKLEALSTALLRDGITPEIECADMCNPADVARLLDRVDTDERPLAAAVLNAGVTLFGPAIEQDWSAASALLSTNVVAPVQMVTELAKRFKARPEGGALMMVSSLGGFAPFPWQALYGASKALMTSYGLSLSHELAGSGVSVTVFAPGGIATPMLDSLHGSFKKGDAGIMDVDACARIAIEGMVRRQPLVVPGMLNKLNRLLMELGPRQMVMHSVSRIYRGALVRRSGQ